jgi:DNA-binding PadR family transcriptional regulator
MWELLSFMHGRARRLVLEALDKGPRTPSKIAESTGEHLSHVSRALMELKAKGLVECMTPDQSKNRIYQITEKGREVLKELRGMKG